MGTEGIHTEAAKQERSILTSSYSVLVYPADVLPESYRPVIFSKWLRSLRHGNDYFKLIDVESYWSTYSKYIDSLLHRGDTVVRLAVLTDDKDVVLGFSLTRGTILEFVYVHKDHRKVGIGTSLVPKSTTTITHLTKTALTIWGSKYSNWKFNPFA